MSAAIPRGFLTVRNIMRFSVLVTGIVCLFATGFLPAQTPPPKPSGNWKASGKHGAVAAGGQDAVNAGLEILQSGGKAADAAAAAILVMTVTDSTIVYFGGEVPILYYDAGRKVVEVLCGQGAAPRLATCEHFAKKGGIPGNGVLVNCDDGNESDDSS